MQIRTHLRHISYSEDLHWQMQQWIENVFRFAESQDLSIDVYVSKVAPRQETHGPLFECHMKARGKVFGQTLFAKQQDFDFWSAFVGSCKRLNYQLHKLVDRKRQRGLYG